MHPESVHRSPCQEKAAATGPWPQPYAPRSRRRRHANRRRTPLPGFENDPDVTPQQLNGMRLALAERYFEAGDYRSATEVFRTVLDSDPTPSQASETLGRLGWILYANDEVGPAEVAFTQAIETFDGNGEARYFFSLMLLETDRGAEAVRHLEALMDDPSVPEDLRPEIEAMLEAARA